MTVGSACDVVYPRGLSSYQSTVLLVPASKVSKGLQQRTRLKRAHHLLQANHQACHQRYLKHDLSYFLGDLPEFHVNFWQDQDLVSGTDFRSAEESIIGFVKTSIAMRDDHTGQVGILGVPSGSLDVLLHGQSLLKRDGIREQDFPAHQHESVFDRHMNHVAML